MQINFTDLAGQSTEVTARPGDTLMRTAIDSGIAGIIAECGGSLACATCHVYVGPEWIERVPAPSPAEDEMLDCVSERRPGSRLSCQIVLEPSYAGMTVTIPETQY